MGGASRLEAKQMLVLRLSVGSTRLFVKAGTCIPVYYITVVATSCILIITDSSLVAIARGEQEYFDPNGIPTATEACKSNALMRCCKDLGIASELW